eukprot:gene2777-2819_t
MAGAAGPGPSLSRASDQALSGVLRALQAPAVRQRLEDMGGEARGSTPEEMKVMVSHEIEKWQQVVADAKIPKQ